MFPRSNRIHPKWASNGAIKPVDDNLRDMSICGILGGVDRDGSFDDIVVFRAVEPEIEAL